MHLSQLINLKMISHRFKYLVPLLTSFNFMSYRNTSGMGEPFFFFFFFFFFGGGGGDQQQQPTPLYLNPLVTWIIKDRNNYKKGEESVR